VLVCARAATAVAFPGKNVFFVGKFIGGAVRFDDCDLRFDLGEHVVHLVEIKLDLEVFLFLDQAAVLIVLEAIVLAIAREVFRKTSLSIWLKPALPVLVISKGVVLIETVVMTGVLSLD